MSERKIHPFSTPAALSLNRFEHRSHGRRSMTPNGRIPSNSARLLASIEGDTAIDEDPRLVVFKALYEKSEVRLAKLFEISHEENEESVSELHDDTSSQQAETNDQHDCPAPIKRKARNVDEDDYGDEDSDDAEELNDTSQISPVKSRIGASSFHLSSTTMLRSLSQVSQASTPVSIKGSLSAVKTTEAIRKKLEDDKKASEDAAKRSFHMLFYTLENDRDAMLEQRKLEEAERKVDAEIGRSSHGVNAGQPGSLSQTNLGASSLTLKNLIRRIDEQRDKVEATDLELRSLMSEVKKNRSKWASEDKIGQEELYETFDKVLSELKGHTEHSTHFLNKVNKKDAPDYGSIVKLPMDLGTMTKKLKAYQYKSKREFVDDLTLIWSNCLKYNANPDHYMRKHALFMRKETEKLVPLIPDIVIRDKAEVEAEERRQQHINAIADGEGDEESDDEPIISSRGRMAPSKKSKKGVATRKAPVVPSESKDETKQGVTRVNGDSKETMLKQDSDHKLEGSQTPPPGIATPTVLNGVSDGFNGILSDAMDVDNDSIVNGQHHSDRGLVEEPAYEDAEYKTWKRVTKRDRATVTTTRHLMFKRHVLDPDAPALLRNKAGMRNWLRHQRRAAEELNCKGVGDNGNFGSIEDGRKGETLAEEMEDEDEKMLPDYYDPTSAIPDLSPRLQWVEDSQGFVQDSSAAFLHEVPKGQFISTDSLLTRRINDNINQIQQTRKITAKIGVVKQMALQTQLYQGQFQKADIIPLHEQDIEAHVATSAGPIIAPRTARAALQRSTAKLLVHAGFEEFQPSALDTFTDLASDYFSKLTCALGKLAQAPKVPCAIAGRLDAVLWKTRFTTEEQILHSLKENGTDLDALDLYVNEETSRAGSRLGATHERMKSHLADLLRPALQDAGPDGSGAFKDGSDQFVSGDFAEELGDDFFGFKELGLLAEFGGASMSVPLHLLQKSMFNAHQAQNSSTGPNHAPCSMPVLEPLSPITIDNIGDHIGIVQEFFLQKLQANQDRPLVEDDELPVKQRLPKPRLPPNGKISSPRKRPYKEPGPGKGHPRKKMKVIEGDKVADGAEGGSSAPGPVGNGPLFKLPNQSNGEPKSREPSKMINGIQSGATNAEGYPGVPLGLKTGAEGKLVMETKGKGALGNRESGSLPSPESVEAL